MVLGKMHGGWPGLTQFLKKNNLTNKRTFHPLVWKLFIIKRNSISFLLYQQNKAQRATLQTFQCFSPITYQPPIQEGRIGKTPKLVNNNPHKTQEKSPKDNICGEETTPSSLIGPWLTSCPTNLPNQRTPLY